VLFHLAQALIPPPAGLPDIFEVVCVNFSFLHVMLLLMKETLFPTQ
jgi:hypothetical protein